MAKSARASTKKRNHANLRTKVFGPAFDARTARLSAKLQELANAPKPDQERKMDIDIDGDKDEKTATAETNTEEPEVEAMQWTGLTSSRKSKSTKAAGRINKVARRKPRNQIVFPSEAARKKRQAKSKKV